MELTKKQNERLNLLNSCRETLDSEQREERHELTFRKNLEKTYGLRLQGDNKYYYAYQIAEFIDWIEQNGIKEYSYEEIKEVRIGKSFYCHDIDIILKYGGIYEFKRFHNLKSLLSFIEGYNSCKNNLR